MIADRLQTLLLGAVVVAVGVNSCAGEIEEIRTSVHTPGARDHSPARAPGSQPSSFDDGESLGDIFWGMVVCAPYWAPYSCFDEPGWDRFAEYTQSHGHSDYKESFWFYDSTQFISSARGQVEYGSDFDGIETVGARLQVDLPVWRLTLDGSWTNYYEQLAGGQTDHLALGDANVVYRFAQNSHTVWRSGVGIHWLNDNHTDVGFNFTYGFDVLPRYPYVWSTEIDWGILGHAELFRGRTTIGAQWREGEVYTGFEYLDIERGHIPTLLVGFRYWW